MITDVYDPRGGGGLPYKRDGVLVRNFKRTPKSCQDPVLQSWPRTFFTPKGTNFNTTHYLLSYIFRLNTPNSTAKIPTVDLLRLNTLRGTKTAFLDPESYDEHPCPFYMEVPPPPPPPRV